MPAKTKQTQKEDLENVHGRDLFMTPNYATELIIPFLDKIYPKNRNIPVWECAAGQKKMSKVLERNNYKVISTDLSYDDPFNFLTDDPKFKYSCIITNPPFSLKKKFFDRCCEMGVPFALLIPADYAGWTIEAIRNGAEKIIPTRRIDYITPNVLNRIWYGESWERLGITSCTMKEYIDSHTTKEWEKIINRNLDVKFSDIYKAPAKLLRKYSSSDFHSMWLTSGFDLGQTETFVDLTNEMKDNI